jgi:acetyl-CoA carboxylase biotin carboxyl carrier protein
MDRERILRVVKLLKTSRGATELEVEEGGLRVKVVRACAAGAQPASSPSPPPADGHMPALREGVLVHSHLVGFFRRAGAPGGEPLAQAGQWVKAGQPVAAVEALSRYLLIEAPVEGQIIAFLAEDGASVEYGTPLVRLRPKAE